MRLKDRTAVITGGGQGIGRGIALLFAGHGARVAIAARSAEKLERVKSEIEEAARSWRFRPMSGCAGRWRACSPP